MSPTIAIVVGSLRRQSINRRLAEALTRLPAAAGATFTWPEIGDLPLYNQDDDDDQPAATKRLKAEIRAADGVIFVTPEYNRSFPGVLKNAIDHASRPYGDSAWAKKPAAVIGTTPSPAGTALAQQHLRNVIACLDMPTLNAPEVYIQMTEALITPEGTIGPQSVDFLNGWMQAFLAWVERHRG